MAGTVLDRILEQAGALSDDEALELVDRLRRIVAARHAGRKPKWRDIRGSLPYVEGEDAQEWITRERAEAERKIPRD